MVFFPSYRLMEDVLQVYEEEFSVDWVRCVCQTPDMTEKERKVFGGISGTGRYPGRVLCLEGFFSEGADLTGKV